MSRLNKIMLVMTSAILAATLSFGLIVFGDLRDMEAWLVGGVIFLLVAQTHSTLARASERKLFVKNIADINSFASGLNRDLERAEADIEVLTERLETETKTRNEEIVAEMRVIESFVKRLAEERQPAKSFTAGQPSCAPARRRFARGAGRPIERCGTFGRDPPCVGRKSRRPLPAADCDAATAQGEIL